MFNNDYIMRMIEQLVQGIALIMGLKKENKLAESSEVLSGTLRKFFGLNDQSVDLLPYKDLMAMVSLGGMPDPEKCYLLAQLVKEKADIEALQGRAQLASVLYCKALNIYISALLSDGDLNTAEHRARIDEIAVLAGQTALPPESRQLLFQYDECVGRFGKAEDMLYELLSAGEGREGIAELGRAFYQRLLDLTDDELNRGNLPRNEVLDGLNHLC